MAMATAARLSLSLPLTDDNVELFFFNSDKLSEFYYVAVDRRRKKILPHIVRTRVVVDHVHAMMHSAATNTYNTNSHAGNFSTI